MNVIIENINVCSMHFSYTIDALNRWNYIILNIAHTAVKLGA